MRQHTDEGEFTVLHSRRRADDSAPALTDRFLSHLDGQRAQRRGLKEIRI